MKIQYPQILWHRLISPVQVVRNRNINMLINLSLFAQKYSDADKS